MNGYPSGSLQAAASGMLQGGGTPLSPGGYAGLLGPSKRLTPPPPRKPGADDMAKMQHAQTIHQLAQEELGRQDMEKQQEIGFGDVIGATGSVLGLIPGAQALGGILGAFAGGVGSGASAGTTPQLPSPYAGLLSPGQLNIDLGQFRR
jgi:hypothetical protein